MDSEAKEDLLRQIRDEVLNLAASPLRAERVRNGVFPVIGEGSHKAELMFVGEAPGRNEAATGRPFCGAAGKVLDGLLASIGVERASVYITNILKDRPPMNRDPLPEEIALYAPFLDRQLSIIRPKIVAALGRYSMAYLMEKFELASELRSISQIHGKVYRGTFEKEPIVFVPLYHPAVAIYDRSKLEVLEKDFQIVRDALDDKSPAPASILEPLAKKDKKRESAGRDALF
ncbi:MAG: uracil-DNA glycosylase [Candidatus Colwellbacteria bacterium]|nr:uracil-DNA glycosylase [Candidatus Colwellbacteria bacterium]